jgi:hypothetical protein
MVSLLRGFARNGPAMGHELLTRGSVHVPRGVPFGGAGGSLLFPPRGGPARERNPQKGLSRGSSKIQNSHSGGRAGPGRRKPSPAIYSKRVTVTLVYLSSERRKACSGEPTGNADLGGERRISKSHPCHSALPVPHQCSKRLMHCAGWSQSASCRFYTESRASATGCSRPLFRAVWRTGACRQLDFAADFSL